MEFSIDITYSAFSANDIGVAVRQENSGLSLVHEIRSRDKNAL